MGRVYAILANALIFMGSGVSVYGKKITLRKWILLDKVCISWAACFLCCKKTFESVFKNKFQILFHLHHKQQLFYFTSTDSLAPPIKQKARFKIKDAKCHLRPRSKEKTKDTGKQAVLGMLFLPAHKQHSNFLLACLLVHVICFHTADRKK